jgi:hypothetical protein
MNSEPGAIRHLERYKQLIEFTGLQFERKITPTDIDASLDFEGREWVFVEYKSGDAQMPGGQRRHLEALCDNLNTCTTADGRSISATAMLAVHNCPPSEVINGAQATVASYYWKRAWKAPETEITVRDAIERFRAYIQKKEHPF